MKRDETKVTKKSVRKMNIDDLPVNDGEDFEFHPDFDEFGFFEEPETKEEYLASQEDFSGSAEDLGEYMRGMEAPSGKQRIKKLKLTPEEIQERKEVRKKRRSQNPEILAVTYVFAALFVAMISYFVYFNAFVSKNVINSAYNVRVNTFADTVVFICFSPMQIRF